MTVLAGQPEVTGELDPRDPLARLGQLLDVGSIEDLKPRDSSTIHVVRGRIDGSPVIAYCSDATRVGGALGWGDAMHIVDAINRAVHDRVPVIGVWHSGGAKLTEGVLSMDGVGQMFAAMTRASGKVPQISVVLGPAAGAAAYGPALTDLVIMSETGRMFVTGPDVVRTVTGEEIDMPGLGGVEAHGKRSGVVHVTTATEQEAFTRTRRIVGMFARPGVFDLKDAADTGTDLSALLPDNPRRAYDVRVLLRELLDTDINGVVFEELQAKWAANVVIGLGRLAGRTVGVIANNPMRKGGCLDSLSAEKAARFVRLCDSFGIPLAVVVDVPGYLPGVGQEWGGVIRRGAKLLYAFAEAVVPRVTLVTRKSYGGAYIAMNSRSLGATTVLAWPAAEVAVMGAEAAVGILHRKKLAAVPESEREALRAELIAEHTRIAGGVERGMEIGVIDEVIEPAQTRHRLAEALATAPAGRGHHGNIPL
ncbi:acyl-CoA carboxylase subunit beta [Kutzneria viridogrisea]|uniref:Acetyl-CoA/propionyl-CoA carboxylase carboxyl transferase subunit n=2 Tax=Kutzneria TaxID=43356 RepID=A0ABR6BUC9_9PSEU|nr:carboxyl transferase domain-containing protein [Kutzneria albida]AHH94587.1 putative propionyl-CoA carboxylase beta chain 6 [Kutzneria albida DSM 43870]MBA8930255.1 acetyl-CoA/propionyl-CoA carboxylase carboxyl transferase subunit [Kutzneria viridogrisea]